MPKIDLTKVPEQVGTYYPEQFKEQSKDRVRQCLGDAGGLRDYGVNLMKLPPGNWSSQRHWHSLEDEFVYIIDGEVVLIENDSETILHAGECAAFPKNTKNGHHLVNRTNKTATYLEIGSRNPDDVTTCSDVDMMCTNRGGFTHKDRKPY